MTNKYTGTFKTRTNLVQFLYLVLGIKVLRIQLQNHFIILQITIIIKSLLFNDNVQFHITQKKTCRNNIQDTEQEHLSEQMISVIHAHPRENLESFGEQSEQLLSGYKL